VIGTLAVDGWAVTFCTVEEGPGRAAAPPSPLAVPNVTHQRQVYQLHIIRCGTIITNEIEPNIANRRSVSITKLRVVENSGFLRRCYHCLPRRCSRETLRTDNGRYTSTEFRLMWLLSFLG